MKLSILVPSIRIENLEILYQSIFKSFSQPFEMIVISPYVRKILPPEIKWIQSWRSPNAAQQQGLLEATGDYITFAADDGIFLPGALDMAFESLMWVNDRDILSGKEIVVGKYLEGDSPNPDMEKNAYYRFKYHKAYRLPGVPQDDYIFNCGIISRQFMLELGGWDCQFEATTCAHADLGIRANQVGAKMIMMDALFKCSHQPGKTGDHKPIHEAMKRDLKKFKRLYSKPRQTNIALNNWELTPDVWKERFK